MAAHQPVTPVGRGWQVASSETSAMKDSFLIRLNQLDSSYLVLLSVAGLGLAAAILYLDRADRLGLAGPRPRRPREHPEGLSALGAAVRLGLVAAVPGHRPRFAGCGLGGRRDLPGLTVVCGLAPLFMGVTACLAYMFIDLERYEVERGYKAVHNPLKGQELALHLARYGQQVGVPLLIAATVAMIGGFALLNQGLYETIGRDWYAGGGRARGADLRRFPGVCPHQPAAASWTCWTWPSSHQLLRAAYVRQAAWPASTLLAGFKTFFTLVLLQQIFASLRQGKLLAETITDFWSPHEPIHERARNALPQYGARAIGPLLVSLRSVPSLTKEQRDQLPLILATIGPVDHPRPGPSPARPARARAGHRRRRARPACTPWTRCPCWSRSARTPATWCGRAWSKRWGSSAAPGADPPASGAASAGAAGCGAGDRVVVRVETARRAGAAPRPGRAGRGDAASPPWPTTRRRCGPRPPGRWAGSGRPPRRWPPG